MHSSYLWVWRTDHSSILIRANRLAPESGDPVYPAVIITMSAGRKSSKIYIPHTEDEDCNIAGILEQLETEGNTHGRPIALVQSNPSLVVSVGPEYAITF